MWRKSSYSPHDPDDCVELGALTTCVGIRDSKQTGIGPVLTVSHRELGALLTAVKDGSFDL